MARKPRICLIDDDPMVCDALALGLDDGGFETIVMNDARAALARIEAEPFDIVVTDINMPGFNGAELIAAVRAMRIDLPIVAISGGGSIEGRDVAEVAREQGASVCLTKPFRARELAAALKPLVQA